MQCLQQVADRYFYVDCSVVPSNRHDHGHRRNWIGHDAAREAENLGNERRRDDVGGPPFGDDAAPLHGNVPGIAAGEVAGAFGLSGARVVDKVPTIVEGKRP